MFREMRRQDRALSEEEALELLARNGYGVLALTGKEGYPYGVPLHYVFKGGALYFHCAKAQGLKSECIQHSAKAALRW